jgi:hypothetical protein
VRSETSEPQAVQKIPHQVIVRAPGLLPMLYRTIELAEELGISQSTIVRWAQLGAPHQRDRRGHIWINGNLFASWVESHRRGRSRRRVPIDQAYCLRCRRLVTMENPRSRRVGNMILVSARCPECGSKVNRGSADDQSQ